jgi:hypothetical protein
MSGTNAKVWESGPDLDAISNRTEPNANAPPPTGKAILDTLTADCAPCGSRNPWSFWRAAHTGLTGLLESIADKSRQARDDLNSTTTTAAAGAYEIVRGLARRSGRRRRAAAIASAQAAVASVLSKPVPGGASARRVIVRGMPVLPGGTGLKSLCRAGAPAVDSQRRAAANRRRARRREQDAAAAAATAAAGVAAC